MVEKVRKRVIIKGRVHGVGYRPLLLGVAESLEVEGFFADNIYVDGVEAVEVLLEGEKGKVEAFIEMAKKRKPDKADVKEIHVEDYAGTVMKTESYYRYLTAMQLAKIAEYGGGMIKKQDETIGEVKGLRGEFREFRQEFREFRGEFREFAKRTDESFKLMFEKYGEISEKVSLTLEALKAESAETRRMLADAIASLKQDSAETRKMLVEAIASLKEDSAETRKMLTEAIASLNEDSAGTRKMLTEAITSLKQDLAETRKELKRAVDNLVKLVEKLVGKP